MPAAAVARSTTTVFLWAVRGDDPASRAARPAAVANDTAQARKAGDHQGTGAAIHVLMRTWHVSAHRQRPSPPTSRPPIVERYRTVRLTKAKQAEIWADVRRDGEERASVARNEIARHERTISTLEANQARLVQLSYEDLVSEAVLAREQHRLDDERQQAQTILSRAKRGVVDVQAELQEALNRTKTPYATDQAGSPLIRRILNQALSSGS
jgi:hypothetical protein